MNWKKASTVVVVICVITLLASINGAAEPPAPTKQEDIRKLMEITGAGKLGMQVMNQMMNIFQQGNSGIPDKFWEELSAEVNADELIELVIPIYDKYLTHDDIKGLIKFYETPLGKKLILAQPEITREAMTAGQQWGEKIGKRIVDKLKKEGYR